MSNARTVSLTSTWHAADCAEICVQTPAGDDESVPHTDR
jgi:hypothetical protein